jgi:predicted molibdopterin-dependent oxidoreductase YjgC
VKITINGKQYEGCSDETVLKVATRQGIKIPTLCDHADLTPYGGCRLCVVEVRGARTPAAACTLLAEEGMIIETETPRLIAARRFILEQLLSAYYAKDFSQQDGRDNELLRWAAVYGVDPEIYASKTPRYTFDSDPNPFIRVDLNRCILCSRCVRACEEIQGRFVWGLAERGFATHIEAGNGTVHDTSRGSKLLDARCESCGACVAYCPTGALENRLSLGLGAPDRKVTTTCTYCGVGCQLDLNVKDGKVIRVTSNPEAPVNGMHLCVKGRYGYDFIHHPTRLVKPQVREYLLKGEKRAGADRGGWVEVEWDTALEIVSKKLSGIRAEHGPASIGILTSAKCTNEENFLMNKLARQVIGTNSIDHCARL